ncbi:hypothetical protein O6H91_15G075600 [Diphasiastrum complanatum]|uniref:Uncharacterized protein n=1 Tax=Diphasiastrum complanatum TaxID=34168 RepID=A0ACC2BJU8_DIPCM|nr:hypothetical protein O6H91_Y400700 [Diphasiastrum complanatum]KAJ7530025.1 hypothetical protein O6H91_15G075600 [Diphasiastrum complanatum]
MEFEKGREEMRIQDSDELGHQSEEIEVISSSGESYNAWLAMWWANLKTQVRLLRSALKAVPGAQLDLELNTLLSDCLALYNTSWKISNKDVPDVISGQHSSSLEAAFMWLGGWRPTSALVLVNTVLGGDSQGNKKFDSKAPESLTSELSEKQLSNMKNLQKHTRQAEQELSNEFAVFQMLVADQPMVEVLVSEAASSKSNYSDAHKVIELKIQKLQELLKQAVSLRIQTLQELLNLLTPVQAARCSVTAFELVFSLKTMSTQFGDSFSVHQKTQSTSAHIPEVSGKTTFKQP